MVLKRDQILHSAMNARDTLLVQVYAMCQDWALADDVVQDALLVAIDSWQDVRSLDGVLPWMRRIVHLKTLEHLRRRGRHGAFDEELMDLVQQALSRSQRNPSEHLGQLKQALRSCMRELNQRHQQLLEAFYWQRRSCEELAPEMGKRPEALRQILTRVRQRLQQCVRLRMEDL